MDEHRPLSAISDASAHSEFDDTRSLGVSTTLSAFTSRANTRYDTHECAITSLLFTCTCETSWSDMYSVSGRYMRCNY